MKCVTKQQEIATQNSSGAAKRLSKWSRGGARGGLEEAIAPCRNMLAPRRKVKNFFSEIFGIYNTLKAVFQPTRRKSQPPVGKFLAPPLKWRGLVTKVGNKFSGTIGKPMKKCGASAPLVPWFRRPFSFTDACILMRNQYIYILVFIYILISNLLLDTPYYKKIIELEG